MRHFYFLFPLVILLLVPSSNKGATVQLQTGFEQSTLQKGNWLDAPAKHQKPGFFKRWKAIKTLKQLAKADQLEDETASKLAKVALAIFAGSLVLSVLSNFWAPLGILSLIGFLGSNVMAILILVQEKNKKSLKIARTILITSLVFVLLAILLTILLLVLFVSIFGY